ncbi:MAG: purine-nucleoside phosphorylase [Planctomycetes bacterium]|nr:purine-nucleoside phosphorylase [Planctomycetota bacterium]
MTIPALADRADAAAQALLLRSPSPPAIAWYAEGGVGRLRTQALSTATVPAARIDGLGPDLEGHFLWIPLGGSMVVAFEGGPLLSAGADAAIAALPIYALARAGASVAVVTGGASSLEPALEAPSLLIIEDHIHLGGHSPLRPPIDPRLGPPFLDLANAYDPALLRAAEIRAAQAGVPARAGILATSPGPTLETDAERRFLRVAGAHAVGQSIVAPVIAARHAGLRVLALAGILEGVRRRGEFTDPARMAATAGAVSEQTAQLIEALATDLCSSP